MHDQTADSEREGIVACGASRLMSSLSEALIRFLNFLQYTSRLGIPVIPCMYHAVNTSTIDIRLSIRKVHAYCHMTREAPNKGESTLCHKGSLTVRPLQPRVLPREMQLKPSREVESNFPDGLSPTASATVIVEQSCFVPDERLF